MTFSMIGKFGITGSFGIVFLYTPEIFPTTLRYVVVHFFPRLFATLEHVVIRVNCFHRIPGLIVDNIFFAVHVLRMWNSITEDVVSAAHLSLFISRLVRVNLNQFLIGKMYSRCFYAFCFTVGCYASAVLAIAPCPSVCLSVRLSVTSRSSTKTA